MNDELKQLIEDAAKLLGLKEDTRGGKDDPRLGLIVGTKKKFSGDDYHYFPSRYFNPLDPERGDLMKVAEAAELCIYFERNRVVLPLSEDYYAYHFTKGDYQSLALAVLRAASAVLKARGE
jgi:hypothetical protein